MLEHYSLQANNYETRSETHQGVNHIIVPVVMMVSGVHNGSHGPLFHSIDELGRFPDSWNGIPVSIEHPEENGQGVSANSPDIIDSTVVGRVYNTYVDGEKLKGEVWIDELKLRQISPTAFIYLQEKRPLDVSLGMFTDEEATEGTWNNESYIAIAHNHRPDHLALLPGGTGACSWADGCGIRLNKKGGEIVDITKITKELTGHGYSVIQMNQYGMTELIDKIRLIIDGLDNESRYHYLEEVFDEYVIYRISPRIDRTDFTPRLVKRNYQINEDGTVEFTGDSVPVKRKVEYVETQTTYKRGDVMEKKAGTPCCPEKVELLIQSRQSPFVEDDREKLNTMEEFVIDKLLVMQEMMAEQTKKKPDTIAPEMNEEQAIKVLEAQLSDPQKFKGLLPTEMREQFEHGLALHQERKNQLVQKILTCTEAYTEDELKMMEFTALDKLSQAVKVPVDYSGQNGGVIQTSETEEPLIPPQI